MAELARVQARQRLGRACHRRPAVVLLAERHQLDAVPVGVGEVEGTVVMLVVDAMVVELGGRVLQRAAAAKLPTGVVVPRSAGADQLQRVGLVGAAQEGVVTDSLHLGQAELDRPAVLGLVQVGDPQRHVIDAADLDHDRVTPPCTARSASSSGMARRRRRRAGRDSGLRRPARRRRPSTTVFDSRPRPVTSTSTTSPGSIGREWAGVPDSTKTSPGSTKHDHPAEVGQQVGDRPDQVGGGALLCDLAVQVGADLEVRWGRIGRRAPARGRSGRSRPGP